MEFYRYEDWLNSYGGIDIKLRIFYLVKETPCGYWIHSSKNYSGKVFYQVGGRKRWVSKTSRKRYAYPTKEEAMVNFKARKRRQIIIYRARLERAKKALASVGEIPHDDEIVRIGRKVWRVTDSLNYYGGV